MVGSNWPHEYLLLFDFPNHMFCACGNLNCLNRNLGVRPIQGYPGGNVKSSIGAIYRWSVSAKCLRWGIEKGSKYIGWDLDQLIPGRYPLRLIGPSESP